MVLNIALFGSGTGTSIEFVLNSLNTNLLDKNRIIVSQIITNKDSPIKEIAETYNIPYLLVNSVSRIGSDSERLAFEKEFKCFWKNETDSSNVKPDIILLLGWKYILSSYILKFYESEKIDVFNLHPSLPNTFVGNNCDRKMYNAYIQGDIKEAGSMIHKCTTELDRGEVLDYIKFNIESNSLEEFSNQLKFFEKTLIFNALKKLISNKSQNIDNYNSFYKGKVRNIIDIGYNLYLMEASNRISAYDRHLTTVPLKGTLLNYMSAWWFKNTKHIIDNHYVHHHNNLMIVKKCAPIKLEIVVRGYMTGSSSTSIWTKYSNGERNMYGITFRDGYKKNQILDSIVITPTTKGEIDVPITKEEIVDQNYLSLEQTNFIFDKAVELFKFGSMVAQSRGLILVDTKYEFGFYKNKIILMDELHTCDSSRYWKNDTYIDRLTNNLEPEKYDKDCIRDYVKSKYSLNEIKTLSKFDIPESIVKKVENVYSNYYTIMTGNSLDLVNDGLNKSSNKISNYVKSYFENIHSNLVVIIAGSTTDKQHVEKIKKCLANKNIYSIEYYKSAHKNTRDVLSIIDKYNDIRNIIYVTVAGRSNALSGVVASNTSHVVIACPPFKDKIDCMTNINSTLQCPSNVPVLTCLEPENVALAIDYIYRMTN